MLITGRTTARFIPSHLSFGSNSGIIRVIVVFAGDFVPSPGAEPSAIFKNNDGKELAPGGQDIAITRQSDRRFDVVFTAPPVRVKAGGVLAFSVDAREFLCPFSWEQ